MWMIPNPKKRTAWLPRVAGAPSSPPLTVKSTMPCASCAGGSSRTLSMR